MSIEETIAEAVAYAEKNLSLEKEDEIYVTNLLLSHFGKKEPFKGKINESHIASLKVPDEIVDAIVSYDTQVRLMDEGAAERDATWVMASEPGKFSRLTR